MKYQRIRSLLARNRLNLLYIFVLSVLLLFPAAIAPVFRQVFTDYILLDNAREWLPTLMLVMLGMSAFSAALSYLQQTILLRLSNRIEIAGESSYFWRLFQAPLTFFAGTDSYTLLVKSGDARAVTKLLTQDILKVTFGMIDVALYLFMMLHIDVLMTLIVLALILTNFALERLQGFIRKKMAAKDAAAEGPDADDLHMMEEHVGFDGLQNIEVIKSTASEQHFFERMMGIKNALVTAKQDDDYAEAYEPLEELPEIIFMNLLLFVSAFRIMDREFTIGAYLAFSAYAGTLFGPMNQLLSARKLFRGFEKKLKGLAEDRELSLEVVDGTAEAEAGAVHRKLSGGIVLEGVTFSYDECQERPSIEDVSLEVLPGQRIAVVGKSGAGKTTLLRLLQGLLAPDQGTVTYDGMLVSEVDRHTYALSIGAANQAIMIFSGSIRQNIVLWDEGVTDAEVYRAAGDAGLHTFVASLAGAYDYPLAEGGRNLSGGQRQKIEMARAMLYQPSIVLLDEATSSMDMASIAHIEDMLLRHGSTCIVTSHVIGHLTGYDVILVMDAGRIVARGTHAELLESSPLYRQLYNAEEGQVAMG